MALEAAERADETLAPAPDVIDEAFFEAEDKIDDSTELMLELMLDRTLELVLLGEEEDSVTLVTWTAPLVAEAASDEAPEAKEVSDRTL